jgi:hypothetical protein
MDDESRVTDPVKFFAYRRLSVWLGILGLGLNALWPLIAAATPGQVEIPNAICTAGGVNLDVADRNLWGPRKQSSHKRRMSPHCPLCLGLGQDSPILSSTAPEISPPGVELSRQHFGTAEPRKPYFRFAAHPRCPPASS